MLASRPGNLIQLFLSFSFFSLSLSLSLFFFRSFLLLSCVNQSRFLRWYAFWKITKQLDLITFFLRIVYLQFGSSERFWNFRASTSKLLPRFQGSEISDRRGFGIPRLFEIPKFWNSIANSKNSETLKSRRLPKSQSSANETAKLPGSIITEFRNVEVGRRKTLKFQIVEISKL